MDSNANQPPLRGWRRWALGVLLGLGALPALAVTTTLSPGANITRSVELAASGDIIQLNPGDYYAAVTPAWNDANAFGITKAVKIIGLGTAPNQVRLHGGSGIDYAVKFMRYVFVANGTPGNPSGASLANLTIDGGNGGILVFDPVYSTRLTDIAIKDVVIQTAMAGGSFGILLQNTDRIVVDGVAVTSYQSGLQLINANDTLIMNSTVTNTGVESAAGLGVFGGSGNTIVGNTIGTPKANPALDSGYSFSAGGVVFYNSQANRFENNTVQGHRDDGLDFHALDLTGILPGAAATQQSIDNYAGKNNIVSTGFAAGRTAGSAIWVNCSSNNTWLYANDAQGSAECGTCVWLSKNNMLLANSLHNNRLAGIVVSGGAETPPFCPIPAYQQKPTSNFLQSNSAYYNGNEQLVVRSSDSTTVASNVMSARNGFGGASQACATAGCQAAFALEGDPANAAATSSGMLVAANTSADNPRGVQSDDGKVSGLEFFSNRMQSSTSNRFVSTGLNIDAGPSLGGNFWSQHNATGNPSSATPYAGVFHNTSNQTGLVVDRYPFQTEDFGRGHSVTVFEPRAGTVATGTRKTVRWYAPGCSYADISLDGSTSLASNVPNTGYAVVTIPTSASAGAHTLVVYCKDSAGVVRGQGSSASISLTNSALQLMAPGRDDVFNAGQEIFVGWKKSASITSVDIEFSTDKGVTFSPLVSGQTGTYARVTLPTVASTAYALIRVKSASSGDSTDGVFAVRGFSGAGFANVSAGRKFIMGQMERLEWASPQNSRLVDITASVGGISKPVATNLPDRGNFDWIVPDRGAGVMTLTVSFKTTNGTAISSASTSVGSTLYPTTITFGAPPALTAGGSATVSATTNSSAAVTFSSLATGVCSIAGNTVTALANGSCTIAANAPASGNFSVAPQVTQSFTVGTSQTITFGAAPMVVVDGTATVSATASSGLSVTFSSLTSSVCSVSGTTVSGLAAGTCTVAANQAGNGTYSTAPQVNQSFSVVVASSIARLANLSTRGQVQTGDNVMIGGFIIGGSSPKKVLVRAVGPNLANYGVVGVLGNPMLQLNSAQGVIAINDDWGSADNNPGAIAATGLAPADPKESAILATLNPGAYTAIVSGVGGGTGVGIVEVFEADHPEYPLINLSTRGQVQTGDNVMIGGFIIQGTASQTVLVRAVGPTLAGYGVTGVLTNPKLQLYSGPNMIAENDNWQDASNQAEIGLTGLAPSNQLESAILMTLAPGAYTAIVSGVGGGIGVGIVEVFAR